MSNVKPLRKIADLFFVGGEVTEVEDLTPRLRRVRIVGESLRNLAWSPGQHVRLRVGEFSVNALLRGFPDTLRTFTVWDYDSSGSVDLCLFDHGNGGPGVRWSAAVRVGQPAEFTKPEGRLVLRTAAPYHLFVGDECASVAFGAMIGSVPDPASVYGVVETGSPADQLPLTGMLTWAAKDGQSLLPALRALDLPASPGHAYVAGEARTCQAVRAHLVSERGWSRNAVTVKPFWAPGKRGLD